MTVIELWIPGEPVPKGRPRMTKSGHVYTPERTKTFEGIVRTAFYEKYPGFDPIRKPIRLTISFGFAIPKSWSKKKKEYAAKYIVWKDNGADLDNLEKSVIDALNKVAWYDDSLIVSKSTMKWYAEKPYISILASVDDGPEEEHAE